MARCESLVSSVATDGSSVAIRVVSDRASLLFCVDGFSGCTAIPRNSLREQSAVPTSHNRSGDIFDYLTLSYNCFDGV